MTHPVIVPQPRRERPVAAPILAGSLVLALLIVGGSLVVGQAIEGRASAYRPVNGATSACPAAATERRP